jgi:hypothetical protein
LKPNWRYSCIDNQPGAVFLSVGCAVT